MSHVPFLRHDRSILEIAAEELPSYLVTVRDLGEGARPPNAQLHRY